LARIYEKLEIQSGIFLEGLNYST